MNKKHKIVVIVTGSIAAIKIPFLIKLLNDNGIETQCVFTENAKTIITKEVVEIFSGNLVFDSLLHMQHIDLSRNSDLIVIVPATANIIAKIAHGIADDLATTLILASNKKILIVPAMNPEMWNNVATKNNIALVKERDIIIMQPNTGRLACNEYGIGKMPEIEDILSLITETLNCNEKSLKGYKAIVTSGATREYIDDVRYISNNASGLQGNLIADELQKNGAEVVLISGITNIEQPFKVNCINVVSTDEMLDSVLKNLPADIFISNAGICDFKPLNFHKGKIKKEQLKKEGNLNIEFTKNVDIIATISGSDIISNIVTNQFKRPKLVIGFAMESENIIENAQKKLIDKKCDWIFANGIKSACSTNTHLFFIKNKCVEDWGKTTKKEAAKKIVNSIANFFSTSNNKNTEI